MAAEVAPVETESDRKRMSPGGGDLVVARLEKFRAPQPVVDKPKGEAAALKTLAADEWPLPVLCDPIFCIR